MSNTAGLSEEEVAKIVKQNKTNALEFALRIVNSGPDVVWVFENSRGIRDPTKVLEIIDDPCMNDILETVNDAVSQLDSKITDYKAEIAFLQVRLEEARLNSGGKTHTPRRMTDNPTPYSGEEKNMATRQLNFLNFWSQLKRNWAVDHATFTMPSTGDADVDYLLRDFLKLSHIPGLLAGNALMLNREHFDSITDNPKDTTKWKWLTVEDCYASLAIQYVTLDLSLQASRDFDNLFMKETPLPQFVSELHVLGVRCKKTPEQMVEALRLKVNDALSKQITGQTVRPAKDDYEGWVAFWQKLYDNLEESRHFDKLRSQRAGNSNQNNQNQNKNKNANATTAVVPHNPAGHTHDLGDPMDLSRMDIAPNQCAYCKDFGHNKWNCPKKSNRGGRGGGRGGGNAGNFGSGGNNYRGGGNNARGGNAPRANTSGGFRGGGFGNGGQPNYQNQQPAYGTGQRQQNFNNQYGTGNGGQSIRQVDVPNPGYVYPVNEGENLIDFDTPATGTGSQPTPYSWEHVAPNDLGATQNTSHSGNA